MKSKGVALAFAALPAAALGAFFLAPYAAATAAAFRPGADGLPAMARAFADPSARGTALFTIGQAAASTVLALAIGIPGAWILGSGSFRGSKAVRAIASVPFAMPPVLVVLGFVLFFGNSGWLNRFVAAASGSGEGPLRILYRPQAIVLAHAFYNFPIVLRLAGDALASSRAAYSAAAASSGAGPVKAFLFVMLPLAAPSIASAALLTFLYCFTSFAVVLVLGGGPGATTLPVEIYRAARVSLDYGLAGAFALIETSVAAAAYALYARAERAARDFRGTEDVASRPAAYGPGHRGAFPARAFAAVYLAAAALLVAGPLLSLPVESFLARSGPARGFTLKWWAGIGSSALPALGRSALLAALSATISVLLASAASCAAWMRGPRSRLRSALGALCAAPLASSGIVLGLGWLSLYGAAQARSVWAVSCAHAVAALPFAYGSIAAGMASLPPSAAAAASSLGARPAEAALLIALPSQKRRILSAWAFAAALSLGELNAVLMLGLEGWETLPLLVYRAAGSYRFGAACAAGALLAAACAAAFLLADALSADPLSVDVLSADVLSADPKDRRG